MMQQPLFLIPAAVCAVFAYRMGNRGQPGTGKWYLASLALCALIMLGFSRFPHSPISCIAHKDQPCAPQGNALMWAFIISMLPACIGFLFGGRRS